MSNKKQQLICITGSDGVGKSTLIENLLKHFPNAVECSIWDAFSDPTTPLFSSKQLVDDYVCALTPNARTLFFAQGLLFAIEKAIKTEAEYIFINAYFYKYFAADLCLGTNPELVKSLTSFFPHEHKTIYLKLSPEISVLRKKRFSRFECGGQVANNIHFIAFQNAVNPFFEKFIQPNWLVLNAADSPDSLLQNIVDFINKEKI